MVTAAKDLIDPTRSKSRPVQVMLTGLRGAMTRDELKRWSLGERMSYPSLPADPSYHFVGGDQVEDLRWVWQAGSDTDLVLESDGSLSLAFVGDHEGMVLRIPRETLDSIYEHVLSGQRAQRKYGREEES